MSNTATEGTAMLVFLHRLDLELLRTSTLSSICNKAGVGSLLAKVDQRAGGLAGWTCILICNAATGCSKVIRVCVCVCVSEAQPDSQALSRSRIQNIAQSTIRRFPATLCTHLNSNRSSLVLSNTISQIHWHTRVDVHIYETNDQEENQKWCCCLTLLSSYR